MKKVLFASTALVASAGFAAADITFGGSANMGLFYNGTSTIVKNEIDFDIKGSGETDGGIAFGASMDIDGSESNGTTSSSVGDPEVYIEVGGLKLTVGNVGQANDNEGLSDVGFDGLGVDDVAEVAGGGSADVLVNYSFGDVKVAASVDSANDNWGLGVEGSFSGVSAKLGYGENGGNEEWNLFLGYTAGAFSVGAQYSDAGATDGWGLQGAYTQGDLTVTAVYASSGSNDAYGIGVAYSLGGGATVAGGIAEVNNTTVADLGMTFSF